MTSLQPPAALPAGLPKRPLLTLGNRPLDTYYESIESTADDVRYTEAFEQLDFPFPHPYRRPPSIERHVVTTTLLAPCGRPFELVLDQDLMSRAVIAYQLRVQM
ncbi:MAG: hypothetical protein JSS44_03815 [Proteobacteria bacterium]|nr:hypothetical protein [Pseudomonadota bacterium]